jgi:hypothetical protein
LAFRLRLPPDGSDADDGEWEPDEESDEEAEAHEIDVKSGVSPTPPPISPLKRPAGDELFVRPFKRHKGLLNMDYLDLLNREIEDAAHRVCLEDQDNITWSQLGLTVWSDFEKKVFFEALSRLGRDDLEGIAAKIGSKSVVEVKHYLTAVQQDKESRRDTTRRLTLMMAEYPAAVELSQPCCRALEETADTISVKEERREQQREQARWGHAWDLTPEVARRIDQGDLSALGGRTAPSVELFDVGQWLKLSRHVFMNSSIPSENWAYIDEAQPSIWTTTMEDFYSLAVSITRRLVQTTIFTTMSRIRARSEYRQRVTRNVIHRRDVEAAISSLNMARNSQRFWRRSARRLRLSVYEEPPDEAGDGVAAAPLSYDEVEMALEVEEEFSAAEDSDEIEEDSDHDSDSEQSEMLLKTEDEAVSEDDHSAIDQEANEILRFSAADLPETYKLRQALKNRVAMEQQQERHAGLRDDYESYQAELEMWELLQRDPPMGLPKKSDPGPSSKSSLDVNSIYHLGRDWRANTEPWHEWEMDYDRG